MYFAERIMFESDVMACAAGRSPVRVVPRTADVKLSRDSGGTLFPSLPLPNNQGVTNKFMEKFYDVIFQEACPAGTELSEAGPPVFLRTPAEESLQKTMLE